MGAGYFPAEEGPVRVLPAIDLMGGKAVRLTRGDPETAEVVGDPLDLARQFAQAGIRMAHVVDLDGAFAGKPQQLTLIAEIARILPIQVGGGIRSASDAWTVHSIGASRIVVGTMAFARPDHLKIIQDGPAYLVVAIDVGHDGFIQTHGWKKQVRVKAERAVPSLKGQHFFCTAVHRDGTMEGPDLDVVRRMLGARAPNQKLTVAGGIRNVADIQACFDTGAAEVVVGKALYNGGVTLQELARWT